MPARITVDVGGTCTDLVVTGKGAGIVVGKALTSDDHPEIGLREALADAATQLGTEPDDLLGDAELFVYSTTRATNAIVEGTTSPTALLVTDGFADVLVRKEGGRLRPYDFATPFPKPYIPRRLTITVPERIGADGGVITPLTEDAVDVVVERLRAARVEAVAIALLWSIANPVHERILAARIAAALPELAVSVSHQLNPIMREYRRASSVALDASLKPVMQQHLRSIERWLTEAGFAGRLVAATSFGGVLFFEDMIERPIYAAKSGPSLAPMAGLAYVAADVPAALGDLVVCDTGGTSFDVSLVRDGRPVHTRETWLGEPHIGHLTGLASLDVRSVGAGGGSIAWVDRGGLLRVGPRSAGSRPGPACYGRGGRDATVTDAAATLGYLDASSFLGGRITLDIVAAKDVVAEVGEQIGLGPEQAARAILTIAGERMADAIREITINEGVDPRDAVIVAGGGAAGMTIVPIVDAIGCTHVVIPSVAGALSAAGGQFTDVVAEFTRSLPTTTDDFDRAAVRAALDGLDEQVEEFAGRLDGTGVTEFTREYLVEARYADQIWDLEIVVDPDALLEPAGAKALRKAFDCEHQRVFAISADADDVELLTWKVRVRGLLSRPPIGPLAPACAPRTAKSRLAVFDAGPVETAVLGGTDLPAGYTGSGPLLVTMPTTTIVVPPGWNLMVATHGSFVLTKETTR